MEKSKKKPSYAPRNNYDQKPEKWKYPPMYIDSEDATEQWRQADVDSLDSGDPFKDQDAQRLPYEESDDYTAPGSNGSLKISKIRKKGAPK